MEKSFLARKNGFWQWRSRFWRVKMVSGGREVISGCSCGSFRNRVGARQAGAGDVDGHTAVFVVKLAA
jgi:hypothetical protein